MHDLKEVFVGFAGRYYEDLSIIGISANEDKIRECLAQAYYEGLGDPGYFYRRMPLIEFTGFDKNYSEYFGVIYTNEDEKIIKEILSEYPKSYFEKKVETKTNRMSLGIRTVSWKTLEELFREFEGQIPEGKELTPINYMASVALAFAKNFEEKLQLTLFRSCMVALECFIQKGYLNEDNYDDYITPSIIRASTDLKMDRNCEFYKLMLHVFMCFDNNEISLDKSKLEQKALVKTTIKDITEIYYKDKEMGLI